MPQGVSPTKRLENVERDLRDHAKSLSTIINNMAENAQRIKSLEAEQISYKVYMAREEERDKALQSRLGGIEKSLEGIKGGFTKLLWIIGTGVVGAFIAFIMNGGLRLP